MEDTEIILGTYENHILGYKLFRRHDNSLTLQSSFTDDSHRGAIRCLTVSTTGILASSSTDDSIRLHSLRRRKEVGGLFQHNGSVNSIRFFKGGHMLSASEDGTVGLWKCRKWELLRLLKGHKSHVKAIAVHPSGKLGLTVGSDRSLFTWDLTTGKVAFRTHTQKVAEDILFTEDGNHYVVVYQKTIDICDVQDTTVVHEIDFGSRINSVTFIKNDVIAVGGDDRHVLFFNILSGKQLLQIDCGQLGEEFIGRIRCLSKFLVDNELFLVMATTSGTVKMCKIDLSEDNSSSERILSFESGVRVTCMTSYNSSSHNREVPVDSQSSKSLTSKKAKKGKKRKAGVADVNVTADSEESDDEEHDIKVIADIEESDNEENDVKVPVQGEESDNEENDHEKSSEEDEKVTKHKKRKFEATQETDVMARRMKQKSKVEKRKNKNNKSDQLQKKKKT